VRGRRASQGAQIRPDVDPEIAAIDAAGERRDAFGRIRQIRTHIRASGV
jgi:hypothetical protein